MCAVFSRRLVLHFILYLPLVLKSSNNKLSPRQAVVIILSSLSLDGFPEFIRGKAGPRPTHCSHFAAHGAPAPPPSTPALGRESVHLLGSWYIRWGAEEAVEEMADGDREGR